MLTFEISLFSFFLLFSQIEGVYVNDTYILLSPYCNYTDGEFILTHAQSFVHCAAISMLANHTSFIWRDMECGLLLIHVHHRCCMPSDVADVAWSLYGKPNHV